MSSGISKTAIVTGAGHGIGRATVAALSAQGWKCVCGDIDGARAEAAAKAVSGFAVRCDVSDPDSIARLVNEASSRYGRIDAIVSNAGINQRKALKDTTLGDWNAVIAINLTAAFLLAKAAEQKLRDANGSMVLVASTRAHMSEAGTFAYSASKGGLVALSHALAISLGPDIRVNCVSPGWISVDEDARLSPEDHAQHPAGRVGRPEDTAASVAFLLSEQAAFITGAELIIDGGMTRKMIYAG